MPSFNPDYCPKGDRHSWQRDPQQRGEGLICSWCGLSEAEMENERHGSSAGLRRDNASIILDDGDLVVDASTAMNGLETWNF